MGRERGVPYLGLGEVDLIINPRCQEKKSVIVG